MPCLEGWICWINYRLTVVLLLGFLLSVSLCQFLGFGNRIACYGQGISEDVWNTACFGGTQTFTKHGDEPRGYGMEHPGISHNRRESITGPAAYHLAPYILLVLVIATLAPHFLFLICEEGRVSDIKREASKVGDGKNKLEKDIANYLIRTRNTHTFYMIKLIICSSLYFFTSLGCLLYITPTSWRSLASSLSNFEAGIVEAGIEDWHLYEAPLFPKMTRCTLSDFAGNGGLQTHAGLCHVGINIMNEQIFLFLKVWFIILICLNILNFLYEIVCIVMIPKTWQQKKQKNRRLEELNSGDWFILRLLSKALSPALMERVFDEMMSSEE